MIKTPIVIKHISRSVLCCAFAMLAPVAFDSATTTLGYDLGLAKAQAQSNAERAKTRRLPGISERMLKELGKVQELIAPTEEEGKPTPKPNLPAAIKELQKMERDCRDKCNSVELSSIYRFYGYAYVTMEKMNEAMNYYKKLVALAPGVTIAVELEALFILAQLSYQEEKYDDSLKYLQKWMDLSTIVGSDKIFLYASICYAKGDMRCALQKVNEAIKMEEDKGKIAKEQWYGLKAALLLEKEDYKNGVLVMEKLVRHYSKPDYWTRLSSIYGLLNRRQDQLHALETVFVAGDLNRRQEFVNLAYLYLENEVPYKAAQVLEEGMKKKAVERDVKHLKILGMAYTAAKETEDAIKVYTEAAKAADREDRANKGEKGYKPEEGNIYTQLSSLYLDADNSKGAIEAGKKAVAAGNLEALGETYTNMGIAYVDIEQYKNAMDAFENAKKDKRTARFAENWYRHAEQEYERQQQLQKAMQRIES